MPDPVRQVDLSAVRSGGLVRVGVSPRQPGSGRPAAAVRKRGTPAPGGLALVAFDTPMIPAARMMMLRR